MKKRIQVKSSKINALLQAAILITATFAIAFIIHESDKNNPILNNPNDRITKRGAIAFLVYEKLIKTIFSDKNFVSATTLSSEDLTKGVYTCVQSKTGKSCQEFLASECDAQCDGVCIPSPRKDVLECKPGTCYDKTEGTCQVGSPKSTCEPTGKWFDDPNGNVLECKKGCCVVGDQAFFATGQECARKAQTLNITKEFKPEINTELACLVLSHSQEEGACVYDFEFERTCKFTTKSSCLSQKGEFHSGLLCSNTELKTNCVKQARTSCVDGKDELYWFDSCGNRENIYDANKIKSWNDGKILSKNESCSVGTGSNPFSNQKTCGNCNYLAGSICAQKTDTEKLADGSQNYVCKDLRCKDEQGIMRDSGESWCTYQGSIGTDKGVGKGTNGDFLRATDTVGSRDFRRVCIDGEIRTEACADFRNEICVEGSTPLKNGQTFTSAACRINRWQQCLNYNTQVAGKKGAALKTATTKRDDQCSTNPDCFVKEVKIDKNFKFNICAPKYPGGFDLNTNGESAQEICSLGSQKCTAIFVKGIGGWECKANCNCLKAGFAQQMNDLCISLGDCGAKVNYQGTLTQNYNVKKAPKLAATYLNKLKSYSEPVKGKTAEPGNVSQIYGELGIPEGLGGSQYKPTDAAAQVQMLGMISGAAGVALIAASHFGIAIPGLVAAGTTTIPGITAGSVVTIPTTPALTAFGGVLAGGAIGFAATTLLIKFTGIGPGLSPVIAYGLMVAGAAGGAIIGYVVLTQGLTIGSALGLAGIAIIAAVLIVILVFKLLGVGKSKKVTAVFECKPWQAPMGGSQCEQCGKDKASDGSTPACGKYACQSLGQTCEFINEGTNEEACVDISPNDASAPVIKPLNLNKEGYSYTESSDLGTKFNGPNGCLQAYTPALIGVSTNEPAQCKFDTEHKDKFEDMEFDFGSSLFTANHTLLFTMPSLESLGITGFDPSRKSEYNLYLRCQDKNGNINTRDYAINFCISAGDDVTPPIVNSHEPAREKLMYNATTQDVSVFVNEPSECRWDIHDKDYDLMANNFACDSGFEASDIKGFECSSNFPIGNNSDKFYVRCLDQPWLTESNGTNGAYITVEDGPSDADIEAVSGSGSGISGNAVADEQNTTLDDEENINDFSDINITSSSNSTLPVSNTKHRNKNTQSYVITYSRSSSNLNIDYVKPDNETIVSGVEPVTVNMEAKTSGGVDGTATCSYGINGNYIPFFDTFGSIHKQTFQSFLSGDKVFPVRCEDVAGNIAEKTIQFKVEIDTTPPLVTRVYNQAGTLNVITNEEATCSYVNSLQCNFEFDNGTIMSGTELTHSSTFDDSVLTAIKCRDKYGNTPGSCSIIVSGGKFN